MSSILTYSSSSFRLLSDLVVVQLKNYLNMTKWRWVFKKMLRCYPKTIRLKLSISESSLMLFHFQYSNESFIILLMCAILCVKKEHERINQIDYLVFVSLSKNSSFQGAANSQKFMSRHKVVDGFLCRCYFFEQFTHNNNMFMKWHKLTSHLRQLLEITYNRTHTHT